MTAGRVLVQVAWSWWSRCRGLLARPVPEPGTGLLIPRCRSVHTVGMHYPIDVVFLDDGMRVVAVHGAVPPGRHRLAERHATHTLELRSGGAAVAGLYAGAAAQLVLWKGPTPGKK